MESSRSGSFCCSFGSHTFCSSTVLWLLAPMLSKHLGVIGSTLGGEYSLTVLLEMEMVA